MRIVNLSCGHSKELASTADEAACVTSCDDCTEDTGHPVNSTILSIFEIDED